MLVVLAVAVLKMVEDELMEVKEDVRLKLGVAVSPNIVLSSLDVHDCASEAEKFEKVVELVEQEVLEILLDFSVPCFCFLR